LIGNVTGIKPVLTPCARQRYDDKSWPVLTKETMFEGPDRLIRQRLIPLVSYTSILSIQVKSINDVGACKLKLSSRRFVLEKSEGFIDDLINN
jgi:hypothetical protein